jgi:hypothetical protein
MLEPGGPKEQADARLEGCSEGRGGDGAQERPLPKPRERWTFCGPTHRL